MSGATTEVATLKQALTKAEDTAAKERTEREKHEAQVGEVQEELQALVEKHEALELDSKMRESELAAANDHHLGGDSVAAISPGKRVVVDRDVGGESVE